MGNFCFQGGKKRENVSTRREFTAKPTFPAPSFNFQLMAGYWLHDCDSAQDLICEEASGKQCLPQRSRDVCHVFRFKTETVTSLLRCNFAFSFVLYFRFTDRNLGRMRITPEWKRIFISMVRPTVHTNPSQKRSFSKTLSVQSKQGNLKTLDFRCCLDWKHFEKWFSWLSFLRYKH